MRRTPSDSGPDQTPGPETRRPPDARGDDTLQSAMSVVPGIRRLRPDVDEVEDAVRLARLRAQLLEQDDAAVRMGRFILLTPIGRGGMGTVYEAYDPQLERKVAIKLLRSVDDDTRDALLEEGRTLARLMHPNVVTVYEVGSHDGHSFVVMELLRGPNLRAWMQAGADGRRAWPQVVDVFLAAAHGLAAAHAAGIRHGDVKPDNIVIGDDGRTRVVDFGIARSTAAGSETEAAAGTPPYMAPEQIEGRAVDARADQYGLCASLYEVLQGRRATAWPPRFEGRVPPWLQRIVVRGTAPEPADRFASLDELAQALARGRRSRTRQVLLTGAVAAGALALGLQLRAPAEDPCATIELDLPNEAAHAEPRMLAHLAQLRGLAADLCVAEHAAPEARPELLSARRTCVDEAIAVTREALLSHDVPPLVWPYALDGLETMARCDDPALLRLRPASPEDPQLRERVAAIDWAMQVASAQAAAGFAETALDGLQRLRAELDPSAVALRDAGLRLLESRIGLQEARPIAADELRAVLWSSIAADNLADAVQVAALLHAVVAEREGVTAAATWFELAEALLHRAGDPAPLWAALWRAHARAMSATDRHADAEAALSKAAEYTDPADLEAELALLREVASSSGLARRWHDAEEAYARAIALHRFRHGDAHPGVLELQLEHALALAGSARSDDAIAALDGVIERLSATAGADHGRTLRARTARCIVLGGAQGPAVEEACLAVLADDYARTGRTRRAAALQLDRATLLTTLGQHDAAATILRTMLANDAAPWPKLRITAALARVEFAAGRRASGLALLGERLTNADDRSDVADAARLTEVDLLLQAGEIERAASALQRARELAVGSPIAFVGWRGMIEAAQGRRAAAIADLETGLLMSQVDVDTLGPFAQRLAELRAELDPTDPRVREAAEIAIDLFEYAPATASRAAALRGWLAALPQPPA